MRILVCGGRDFCDRTLLGRELDRLHRLSSLSLVIHGAAQGADALAGAWAQNRGIEEVRFPADWKKHGRAAGPLRNKQMLDEGKPDLVVAFPGGRGTANMVMQAQQKNVAICIVPAPTPPAAKP